MKKIVQFLFVPAAAVLVAALSGCSAPKPFVYTPNTEIKEGAGLLTGEKGEALLYDSRKKEGVLAPAVAAVKQPGGVASAPITAAEEEEFKKFQQWKQERQQLEDFEKWKQSPEGQKEYKEFQDWKRWKEYQQWREAHPDAK